MTNPRKASLLCARHHRQAGAIVIGVEVIDDGEEKCEGCKQPAKVCTTCGVWLCEACYDSIGETEDDDEGEEA